MTNDGQTIEEMISQGRKIVDAVIAEHRPCAIFSGFSGGNDSVVTTHFAATNYGGHALFCRTDVGLQKTRRHANDVCDRFGWHLVEGEVFPEGKPKKMSPSVLPGGVWEDGSTAYEDWVLNFGFPGPGQHMRMYQRLKERSIHRHVSQVKHPYQRGRKVLIISGIRHDESAIRAGYMTAVNRVPKRPEIWVNPFYWRSATDFELYRQEFGLPRNPCKAVVGISGECLCGAYANAESERIAVRKIEPETADYIEDLESRVKDRGLLACKWGERPPRPTKAWLEAQKGQNFLFGLEPMFAPACTGCIRRNIPLFGDPA